MDELGVPAKANGVTAGSCSAADPPSRVEVGTDAEEDTTTEGGAFSVSRFSIFVSFSFTPAVRILAAASMRALRLASILSLRPAAAVEVEACNPPPALAPVVSPPEESFAHFRRCAVVDDLTAAEPDVECDGATALPRACADTGADAVVRGPWDVAAG